MPYGGGVTLWEICSLSRDLFDDIKRFSSGAETAYCIHLAHSSYTSKDVGVMGLFPAPQTHSVSITPTSGQCITKPGRGNQP